MALTNRGTQYEIRAIIDVIGIYCSVLRVRTCFRPARMVLEKRHAALCAAVFALV